MRRAFFWSLAFAGLFACAMESIDPPASSPAPAPSAASSASSAPSSEAGHDAAARDAGAQEDADASAPEPATFGPPPGPVACGFCLTLATSTPGATIYYTTDGTPATTASETYTKPVVVGLRTVNTLTVAPGFAEGARSSAQYSFLCHGGVTVPVAFAPGPSVVHGPFTLQLQREGPSSLLCYTTDGTDPWCSTDQCVPDECGVLREGCDGGVYSPSCTAGTSYDHDAGALITPIPDGGIVVVRAVACSENQNQSEITSAGYSTP